MTGDAMLDQSHMVTGLTYDYMMCTHTYTYIHIDSAKGWKIHVHSFPLKTGDFQGLCEFSRWQFLGYEYRRKNKHRQVALEWVRNWVHRINTMWMIPMKHTLHIMESTMDDHPHNGYVIDHRTIPMWMIHSCL